MKLLALVLSLVSLPVMGAEQPNVLLISIDDLNDWTGCLGGHPQAKTPNIDRLARHGTLFSNAHCQSPVCNPSRASLMTGRYPHSSGVYFLAPDLKKAPALKDIPTLPEVFAANGYETLAAGKLFHSGDARFFQSYGGSFGGFGPAPNRKISQPHGHPLWDWGAFPEKDEDMPDEKVANWAVEQLSIPKDKPFFLAVGFWRPHVPMFAPQRWFDLHPLDEIQLPEVFADDVIDLPQFGRDLTSLEHVAPTHEWITGAGEWEHAVQSYLASVSFADFQLGRVLDALDASPYAENTIIVLFSDHGFHLGEKERWAKRSLWEDGTRVPLIVSAPGFPKNQICDQPAELLDIFPTLLDLAKLSPATPQEGQSLTPLMRDLEGSWDHPAITSFGPGNYGIRTRTHRLIQYSDGSRELYDHRNDPHEWKNLLFGKVTSADQELAVGLAKFLPTEEHALLPGNSTGHDAYEAAIHRQSH